uniref:MSP domain-containing protein n=1 Tax=Globodera pallida TaxID=36090 RepID=A0A183C5S9_GLOPA
MPVPTCVAEKGSKTVTVLNTGHEKARVTVMLTARSDGLKLRPFVLLPKKRPVPDIIKRFNKTLALSWCVGKFFFGSRHLFWDSFRCHISEATKQALRVGDSQCRRSRHPMFVGTLQSRMVPFQMGLPYCSNVEKKPPF